MMFHRRFVSILALCGASLTLSACGEEWVAQPLRGVIPYMEERTAGPGVEYVRAYMLPEKGPVLEPVMPDSDNTLMPVQQDAPMHDAGPIFDKAQAKGAK